MGVSYAAKVYTNDKLFFIKLIFRWIGSVWQLIWVDFLAYLVLYIMFSCVYRLVLYDFVDRRLMFEIIAKWVEIIRSGVPLSFLLGFFVSSVLGRWWSLCLLVPWLHASSYYTQALVSGVKKHGDLARKMRISLLRYLNLAWILMLGDVSMQVQERFKFTKITPGCIGKSRSNYVLTWRERCKLINDDTKVRKYFGKLITDTEMAAFGRAAELSNDDDYSYSPEYWLPLMWASRLLNKAKQLGCVEDDRHFTKLLDVFQGFRGDLGTLWVYSEFNIPLVYTQVVTVAVYIYLISGILSSQMIEERIIHDPNLPQLPVNSTNILTSHHQSPLHYIPILGMFELIFYLGWYKIGICLMNPLGKDKEDLPLSDILNCNLKVSVKCGGSEDSLYPEGLIESGVAEEQIIQFLNAFDFSQVRAHDKFESPEETESRLQMEISRRRKKNLFVAKDKDNRSIDSFDRQVGAKHKIAKKTESGGMKSERSFQGLFVDFAKKTRNLSRSGSMNDLSMKGDSLPRPSSNKNSLDTKTSIQLQTQIAKPKWKFFQKKPRAVPQTANVPRSSSFDSSARNNFQMNTIKTSGSNDLNVSSEVKWTVAPDTDDEMSTPAHVPLLSSERKSDIDFDVERV